MPNEQITLTNMRDDQIIKRYRETLTAIRLADEGARLFIMLAGATTDHPARLTDIGAFEIREHIIRSMRIHLAEIKSAMVDRGLPIPVTP